MFILDLADPGCLSRILRIRHVYPGSWIHGQKDSGSRIRIRIKFFFFLFLTPKKRFQSSRKKALGCSSRIPDPRSGFFSTSWIPDTDPGVNRRLILDPGSGSAALGRAGRFLPSWQGIPRDGTAVAGPGLSPKQLQSSYTLV